MLRVLIESCPYGDIRHRTCLASIEIINDGTGTELSGNYDIELTSTSGSQRSRILNHNRREPVQNLIKKALASLWSESAATEQQPRTMAQLTEGQSKGGQNPPNTSSKRPAPPRKDKDSELRQIAAMLNKIGPSGDMSGHIATGSSIHTFSKDEHPTEAIDKYIDRNISNIDDLIAVLRKHIGVNTQDSLTIVDHTLDKIEKKIKEMQK